MSLSMKIITWNCNMAFRKKADHVLALDPDIVVVPECECVDKLIFPTDAKKPTSILWFGKNVKQRSWHFFLWQYQTQITQNS